LAARYPYTPFHTNHILFSSLSSLSSPHHNQFSVHTNCHFPPRARFRPDYDRKPKMQMVSSIREQVDQCEAEGHLSGNSTHLIDPIPRLRSISIYISIPISTSTSAASFSAREALMALVLVQLFRIVLGDGGAEFEKPVDSKSSLRPDTLSLSLALFVITPDRQLAQSLETP
jgi:hypothetical protein